MSDTPQPQEHMNPGVLQWEARNYTFSSFFFGKHAIIFTSERDFCLGREGGELNSIEHQLCARHLMFLTHLVLVRTRTSPHLTAGGLQLREAADLPGRPAGKRQRVGSEIRLKDSAARLSR